MKLAMNKANKRLISGTAVYMIGSLTSRLLQLLVLPILTGILLTEEYGYYDLIVSTFSLILPITTLKTVDAVFRFMFHADEDEKNEIVSTVSIVLTAITVAIGIIFFIVAGFIDVIHFPVLVFLHFISYTYFDMSQKTARSLGQNKQFAISGVLHTMVLLGVEVICLIVLHLRVDGLLWANIIANSVVIGYLNIGIHFEKRIRISRFNISKLRELLKFSIPLIPNSICWWFVSLCDKYVIAFYLGTSANGIYTVSNKFPQLITFATSVFQLAWQESAIMEAESKERDKFYSGVFNQYLKLLCSAFIAGIFAIRIVMPYMVDVKFSESILYVPPLLFGTVFSAFSQFYGTSYLVSKKTSGVFTTTLISAVVNLIVCLSLIRVVGLWAAPLSTCCAYLVQWLVRNYQLRGEFKVRIEWKIFIPLLGVMLLLSGLYYIISDLALQIVVLFAAICLAVIINRQMIKNIMTKAVEMLKSR